ncbi:uncharacterized protein LOC116406038 isoform X2 [Cucumis sativus]|uniref:uncharacterized protein LOC116406038 isoform X2 n=1 Tax=Cucumis sativus TaxID=3659 RepID=UPI0012F4837C|nr:uncharacterized protein LOC116406038 isoform X2 [Cucumis sativus]XP_031745607.1 uncharacterized protein LOC116406038 isoform X2 [Cucumis sativus]
MKQKVHFTVECHGGIPRSTDVHSTYVSSHRVRSCLELNGYMSVSTRFSRQTVRLLVKTIQKLLQLVLYLTSGQKELKEKKMSAILLLKMGLWAYVMALVKHKQSLSDSSDFNKDSNAAWNKITRMDGGKNIKTDGTCLDEPFLMRRGKDGCLWDTNGHILYSPLPCCVPLPGFENIRFCVSQYDDKDRVLLRNLCFVLGAKFVEKLTKKVTHLICKFTDGTKFEAACKWGKQCITAEWIYECVR